MKGFTLVEMMATLAVAAVLAAIATPGLAAWTASARIETRVRGLVSSLQFARSEAIRGNQALTVCAANFRSNLNLQGCLARSGTASASWSEGVLVYADNPDLPNGRFDSGEARKKLNFDDLASVSANVDRLTLTPEGRLGSNDTPPRWVIREAGGQCASVQMEATGRARACRGNGCDGCA
ncbi:prepilin-type N-terminal cleavage/methylation domain [Gulbenkiania indica]|uniref:Type II secretion system protein H n=2 Tax=Gulbenkiania TaxID=397456 RepID=A0A0K6GTB3_9NEIS|nr:GspH/FimT family pseudopilin [Gulbenkiania indica]TCW31747.1 type IV fimbrial biogenesis protein FimT [Gulbenkiania mobilis]CUA81872.1 prepilin-type N-terminal cleavage/methylation domain [Gulbenkiania indica]